MCTYVIVSSRDVIKIGSYKKGVDDELDKGCDFYVLESYAVSQSNLLLL